MTRVLLDTHALMWWIDEPAKVPDAWQQIALAPENDVYVSSVAAWEIETKKRIGKLRFDHVVDEVVARFEFEPLSVSMLHATLAGQLGWDHRDPFDRMLVAQAISDDMILLTSDVAIR